MPESSLDNSIVPAEASVFKIEVNSTVLTVSCSSTHTATEKRLQGAEASM